MTITVDKKPYAPTVSNKKKKLSRQYIAYLIHSFVGLKLTLLLAIVLLTGALAVFQQELDWLIYPEMRAEIQEDRLNAGELLDRLQAAYPNNGMFFFRTSENYPHLNAYARFIDDNGGWRHAWIDPYSGEVKGDTVLLSIGQFIGFLHATLFLPAVGNSVVNALGLFVLISLVTGMLTFPKFWRYFFRKPRTGNLRVFLGDLHKLIGLWSLWIVLVIGITGSWWFYQDPFVKYFGAPSNVEAYERKPLLSYDDLDSIGESGTPQMLPVKEIVNRVQSAYPSMQINIINPPEHNADPYEIVGNSGEVLLSEWRGDRIMVHPYSGEIVAAFLADDLFMTQRTDLAMAPVHYGTWAERGAWDLVVKAFYFLGGLAMTFLAVSGLLISYKRSKRAVQKVKKHSALVQKISSGWNVLKPWGGPMGVFKYLNFIALAGIMMGTGIALTLSSQGTKGSGFVYKERELGPWMVSANAVAGLLEKDLPPIREGGQTNLNVTLDRAALNEIKFIYARVGKPRSLRAPGTLIHGPVGAKHVHLRLPRSLKDDSELWITAVTWGGESYQTSWSLMPDGKETVDAR
ncbi:PepSY domain-containing protein [Neptuniibacter sp.]|uniref:PepSY-associated TM helix domain-containing protein n=1 Tax=Neptuniibacter sp. TaxID=1962643 RepID=UPI0026211CC9|nr:PepSY-associated TM helix domain-containing protein [Neptuniibacter sp.]MCP4595280.1 PepSY domain-containing protein [Neptuniibacter sp.]